MLFEKKNKHLSDLYNYRFSGDKAKKAKYLAWTEISAYLQRFIPESGVVIDMAAGFCEFINTIKAGRKIAIDLNPDSAKYAAEGVEFFHGDIFAVAAGLASEIAECVFISNLFEHLDNRDQIISLLNSSKRLLKNNGSIVILQPNINLVGGRYYDFFDHKIPLTERSVCEAASLCGLTVEKTIPRFLPYTTKSILPQNPFLVRMYLRLLPISGWLIAGQSLIILKKDEGLLQ